MASDASVPVPSIEWDMDRLLKRSAELHPTLADDLDKRMFAYLLRVNQREVALGLAVNGKVILNGELVEFDLTPDFLADVLSPDIFDFLEASIIDRDPAMTKWLLETGVIDASKCTMCCLGVVCSGQEPEREQLRLLLKHGADFNRAALQDGETPLMAAVANNNRFGVETLLAAGVDTTAEVTMPTFLETLQTFPAGSTALDMAKQLAKKACEGECDDIIRMLSEHSS